MTLRTFIPRESPVLQHPVSSRVNPCRHRSLGALEDFHHHVAREGGTGIEDEVRFRVLSAPDDVEELGKWIDGSLGVGGDFTERVRVRDLGLAALWGDELS